MSTLLVMSASTVLHAMGVFLAFRLALSARGVLPKPVGLEDLARALRGVWGAPMLRTNHD